MTKLEKFAARRAKKTQAAKNKKTKTLKAFAERHPNR